MAIVEIEILEQRCLMTTSSTNAAIAEYVAVVRADRQVVRFDILDLHEVARRDRRNAETITSADRGRVHQDTRRLHLDEQRDPLEVLTDLAQLNADEKTLETDLRQTALTAYNDRGVALGQLETDRAQLGSDRKILAEYRRSGNQTA